MPADKKATARCYKYQCAIPPKHVLHPMEGVTITSCDKHLDAAKSVAATGRPG
jgi:hypothetical protein